MGSIWNLSDKDGFLAWYDATINEAGRYASRLAGRDGAEDLVQDAYFSILRRARVAALTADGPGLVITTIRNRFIDSLRTDQARGRLLQVIERQTTGAHGEPDAFDDPLDGLGDRDRAVLVLRYVEGLSVAAVATEIGISVHAVRSWSLPGAGSSSIDTPQVCPQAPGGAEMLATSLIVHFDDGSTTTFDLAGVPGAADVRVNVACGLRYSQLSAPAG